MHQLKNKTIITSLVIFLFAVLLTAIKFFTVEIRYTDDPTVQLVARSIPSNDNKILIKDEKEDHIAFRILADEGSYLGSGIYAFICTGGWLAGWILLISYFLFKLTKKYGKPIN